jgi:CheY-like chemotaxis protein
LATRCRAIGLSVHAAYSGLAALRSFLDNPPDVICLDVEMPDGNGLSACELLAGQNRLAQIPIIILTGKTDGATIRRCHNLCAYYVPKCVDVWSRLEPLLHELLGNRPAASMRSLTSANAPSAN